MAQEHRGAAAPEPGGPRRFGTEPMLVRQREATRFLWGDEESGQVADLIYGRGERISAVSYALGPGHWFGASKVWKPLYDQHRFYYVVRGSLAIHDPESGDVAVASQGMAVTWRGARYHFGYNAGHDEVIVLDWFAPPDRGLDTPEIATMPAKRELGEIVGGRYDLLGEWPDCRPDVAGAHARRRRPGRGRARHGIAFRARITQAHARLDPVIEQPADRRHIFAGCRTQERARAASRR